jgi:hypothetical protein
MILIVICHYDLGFNVISVQEILVQWSKQYNLTHWLNDLALCLWVHNANEMPCVGSFTPNLVKI